MSSFTPKTYQSQVLESIEQYFTACHELPSASVAFNATTKLTGASRNTLKQHFRSLVERGQLNQRGSGQGVWYELQ